MTRKVLKSRVGPDGVLQVSVPLGSQEANREVSVVIESIPEQPRSQAEYSAWLDRIYGSWQGEFVEDDEGPFETREPFP
jgi:hypothetical protein